MNVEEIKRRHIDDVRRRNGSREDNRQGARFGENASYKNQVFDGKQRTLDEYTGEIIYYGNSKYSSSKQSNVDHVVPIKSEIDRNSWLFENELLLADDTKDALNSSFNLKVTNEALNKSKGAKSNIAVIFEDVKSGSIDLQKADRMIRAQLSAESGILAHKGITVGARTVEKALPESLKITNSAIFREARQRMSSSVASGVDVGVSAGISSSLNNAWLVLTNQKSKQEALEDVLKDTGSAVLAGATKDIIEKELIKQGTKLIGKKYGNMLGNHLGTSIMIANTLGNYINGNISGEKCAFEIVSELGTSYILNQVLVGSATLGPAGIAIGVATAIGVVVDGTLQCLHKAAVDNRIANAKINQVMSIIEEANEALAFQKYRIEAYSRDLDDRYKKQVEAGFKAMVSGALENNLEKVNQGLADIAEFYGSELRFKSDDEFLDWIHGK